MRDSSTRETSTLKTSQSTLRICKEKVINKYLMLPMERTKLDNPYFEIMSGLVTFIHKFNKKKKHCFIKT